VNAIDFPAQDVDWVFLLQATDWRKIIVCQAPYKTSVYRKSGRAKSLRSAPSRIRLEFAAVDHIHQLGRYVRILAVEHIEKVTQLALAPVDLVNEIAQRERAQIPPKRPHLLCQTYWLSGFGLTRQ
jgi:hypothetical protein